MSKNLEVDLYARSTCTSQFMAFNSLYCEMTFKYFFFKIIYLGNQFQQKFFFILESVIYWVSTKEIVEKVLKILTLLTHNFAEKNIVTLDTQFC